MYILLAGGVENPVSGMTTMEVDWVKVYQYKGKAVRGTRYEVRREVVQVMQVMQVSFRGKLTADC
jgi:hypothetical protein